MHLKDFLESDATLGDSPKVGFISVAVEARRAFQEEILPGAEHLDSAEGLNGFVNDVVLALEAARKSKDNLYIRLIRYKSIDQTDDRYFDDIQTVLHQWSEQWQPTPRPPSWYAQYNSVVEQMAGDLTKLLNNQNTSAWKTAEALNALFDRYSVPWAKAQVIPNSWKGCKSAHVKSAVSVTLRRNGALTQIDLRPMGGKWSDPTGLSTPHQQAKRILWAILESAA